MILRWKGINKMLPLLVVLLLLLGAQSEPASKQNEVSWKMMLEFFTLHSMHYNWPILHACHYCSVGSLWSGVEISKGKAIRLRITCAQNFSWQADDEIVMKEKRRKCASFIVYFMDRFCGIFFPLRCLDLRLFKSKHWLGNLRCYAKYLSTYFKTFVLTFPNCFIPGLHSCCKRRRNLAGFLHPWRWADCHRSYNRWNSMVNRGWTGHPSAISVGDESTLLARSTRWQSLHVSESRRRPEKAPLHHSTAGGECPVPIQRRYSLFGQEKRRLVPDRSQNGKAWKSSWVRNPSRSGESRVHWVGHVAVRLPRADPVHRHDVRQHDLRSELKAVECDIFRLHFAHHGSRTDAGIRYVFHE